MSTLLMRSKNLHLSPLTIQPRTRKICCVCNQNLPKPIRELKGVVEIQYFEGNETQEECYLVQFESFNSDWCYFELFYLTTNKFERVKEKKFFEFP